MPWRLLESSDAFVGFLVAYSSLLAPVLGIIVSTAWGGAVNVGAQGMLSRRTHVMWICTEGKSVLSNYETCDPLPQIADYWVVRKRILDIDGLYTAGPAGPYHFVGGWNPAALVSWD